MKKVMLFTLALLAPLLAEAQGVVMEKPPAELPILHVALGGAWPAVASQGDAIVVGARPIRFTRISFYLLSVSGGGAGSSIARLTDGTNVCDCTYLCSASQTDAIGAQAASCTGSCIYAPGAKVYGVFLSSTCTTTQPSIKSLNWLGQAL